MNKPCKLHLLFEEAIDEVDEHFVLEPEELSDPLGDPGLHHIHLDLRHVHLSQTPSTKSPNQSKLLQITATSQKHYEEHEWTKELTKWSSSGANFCVLSSFACLLEKRVSWSADVPCEKKTGNQRGPSQSQIRRPRKATRRRSARQIDRGNELGSLPGRSRPTSSLTPMPQPQPPPGAGGGRGAQGRRG